MNLKSKLFSIFIITFLCFTPFGRVYSINFENEPFTISFFSNSSSGQKTLLYSYDSSFKDEDQLNFENWEILSYDNYIYVFTFDEQILQIDLDDVDSITSFTCVKCKSDWGWKPYIQKNGSLDFFNVKSNESQVAPSEYGNYSGSDLFLHNAQWRPAPGVITNQVTDYFIMLTNPNDEVPQSYKVVNKSDFSAINFESYNPSEVSVVKNKLFYSNGSIYYLEMNWDDVEDFLKLYTIEDQNWTKIAQIDLLMPDDRNRDVYYFIFNNSLYVLQQIYNSIYIDDISLETKQIKRIFEGNLTNHYLDIYYTCNSVISRSNELSYNSFWNYFDFPYTINVNSEYFTLNLGYYQISNQNGILELTNFANNIDCNNLRLYAYGLDPNTQISIEMSWIYKNFTDSASLTGRISALFLWYIFAVGILLIAIRQRKVNLPISSQR